MPQLIVRQIEEKVVKQLKKLGGEHGVSMEEEHRRILRQALLGAGKKRPSFKEALPRADFPHPALAKVSLSAAFTASVSPFEQSSGIVAMPHVGDDRDFERGPQIERPVEL